MRDDIALSAPTINLHPGPDVALSARKWQGIPGIERAGNGRLWTIWYSGWTGEGPGNYVVIATSMDDGVSWLDPAVVIQTPPSCRAFDPVLWICPDGRLWVFWSQCESWFDGRAGVWCMTTGTPESESPVWTEPRRLFNGVMMNKPTVLADGTWLAPAAVWNSTEPFRPDLAVERRSNVFASTDHGATWKLRGAAEVPDRTYDEHMTIQRAGGSLWMLVRTKYGVGESISHDGGSTWSAGKPSAIAGPNSRFHIRRLLSGRLLLVNHHGFSGRSHMTALLSDDDGLSWKHSLLLDERAKVSYPDSCQAPDGRIYVIYDRARQPDGEILMAVVREDDILAGAPVSRDTRLRITVSRLNKDDVRHA